MNTSVNQTSFIGSAANRSRFGASTRRKLMHNAVVPTPRDLKEQSKGNPRILEVGSIVNNVLKVGSLRLFVAFLLVW